MQMTASEARERWKEVLDMVLSGEDVEITRGGVAFSITLKGIAVPPSVKKEVLDSFEDTTPKKITTIITEQERDQKKSGGKPQEWEEVNNFDPEKPCCKRAKNCQHWVWDGVDSLYKNVLSGRTVPVESWGA